MKYFYYNDKGEKKGAFSGKEMKALAKAGLINPQTIIETEEGKQYYARGIGGVEFANESTEQNESISQNAEHEISSARQDAMMLAQKNLEISNLRLRNWQMENKLREAEKTGSNITLAQQGVAPITPQEMELTEMRLRLRQLENKMVATNQPKNDMISGNQLKVETKSEYAWRIAFLWTAVICFLGAIFISFYPREGFLAGFGMMLDFGFLFVIVCPFVFFVVFSMCMLLPRP